MNHKRSILAITLIVVLALLAACAPTTTVTQPPSGSETQPPASSTEPPASNTAQPKETAVPGGETVEVSMKNIQFNPKQVTIKVGTTVVWTNNDDFVHTVDSGTRDNPTDMFLSGDMAKGDTFSYTFTEAGVFPYFCLPHQGMEGTITVTE